MTTPPATTNPLDNPPYPLNKKHQYIEPGTSITYDPFLHPEKIPPNDAVVMARWLRQVELAYQTDKHNQKLEDAYVNIVHSRVTKVVDHDSRDRSDLSAIAEVYSKVSKPLPSVGSLPGSGVIANPLKDIVDFLKLLTTANLWIRILEVALGLGLVLAGLAKLSVGADSVISHVPVYGKFVR